MESNKGLNDALNIPNASTPAQSGEPNKSIEPKPSSEKKLSSESKSSSEIKPSSAQKKSKYAAMVLRSQYPSRWRLLIAFIAVIVSAAIIFTYFLLDVYDILPGPLTLRKQHYAVTVSSPKSLLRVKSLAKGVTYGKEINHSQAQ